LPVTLQHLIGTISIIILTLSISLGFSTVSSYVQTDINKKEMAQVASHVSLNMIEIAALSHSSNYTRTLVKTISLPTEINGRGYLVRLIDETNQSKGYSVEVSLVSQSGVKIQSFLPFNSKTNQTVVVTTLQIMWVSGDKVPYTTPDEVTYVNGDGEAIVFGGNNAVVWAFEDSGVIYIGIGTRET